MTGMDKGVVQVHRRAAVAWVMLNRPETLNAINEEVRRELPRLLLELDEDPEVRVIVLRGAGNRAFCVGADLKEKRPAIVPPHTRGLAWIEAIAGVRKPIIASIHGFCLGGGLEIALTCDVRIASADAIFALPEPSLGLIPGGGATQRLPRLIGLGRALHLLLTAERIDAAAAHRLGIITQIASTREALQEDTDRLASRIASLAPLAIRAAKQAAVAGLELNLFEGLKLEGELFVELLSTADSAEAAAAFTDKRKPNFTGS